MKVTFVENTTGEPETWVYNGGQFTATTNWIQRGGNGGNEILKWNTDVATTRKQVLLRDRKKGLLITYEHPDKGLINEQFIGTSVSDVGWSSDTYWEQLPNQKQFTDLKEQINNDVSKQISSVNNDISIINTDIAKLEDGISSVAGGDVTIEFSKVELAKGSIDNKGVVKPDEGSSSNFGYIDIRNSSSVRVVNSDYDTTYAVINLCDADKNFITGGNVNNYGQFNELDVTAKAQELNASYLSISVSATKNQNLSVKLNRDGQIGALTEKVERFEGAIPNDEHIGDIAISSAESKGFVRKINSNINYFDTNKIVRGYVSNGKIILQPSGNYICSGYQKLPQSDICEFDLTRTGNTSETCLYSGELTDEITGEGLTVVGQAPTKRFKRGKATYIAWVISTYSDDIFSQLKNGGKIVNLQAGEIIESEKSYVIDSTIIPKYVDIISRGNTILGDAKPISAGGIRYAHDSSIIINYKDEIPHLICVYQGHETSHKEFVTGQKAYLVVVDLMTNEKVVDNIPIIEVGKNGCDDTPCLPRLVKLKTGIIRIYYSQQEISKYIDLDSDYQVSGNGITQFIPMADMATWNLSAKDMTVDNLVNHVIASSGKTPFEGDYNFMPVFRGSDNIFEKDGKYYATIELYLSNSGEYGIPMLAESTDMATWKVYPPIVISDSEPTTGAETFIIYNGNEFVAMSRYEGYLISSSDDGMVWSEQKASLYDEVGTTNCVRPSVCKSTDLNKFIIAYAGSNYTGITAGARKSLVIGVSNYLSKTVAIAKLINLNYIHYPCIIYEHGICYMTYTSKINGGESKDRDVIYFTKFNPIL